MRSNAGLRSGSGSFVFVVCCAAALAVQPSTELLANRDGSNQRFASVGRIQASFTCTGAWIDGTPTGARLDPAAPAYFLAAGHCVSLDPWIVIRDRAANYTVTLNYFTDTRDAFIGLRGVRVAWSTMKGMDLALIELNATNGDLLARGLTPHRLGATASSNLYWTGAPTTFIPTGQAYLRRGTCEALGSTTVIEGRWTWFDQIRNDCSDLYSSASGSPLFDADTNAIVGVLGTTTLLSQEGGLDYDCYQNRPCAVSPAGKTVVETDTSYASPVAPLRGCFNVTSQFDLALPGCTLDRGSPLTVDTQRVTAVQPGGRWNVRVGGGLGEYIWKQTALNGSCRDAAGYERGSSPLIDAVLPADEGNYWLCVAPDAASIAHPLVVRYRVDATPLRALPVFDVDDTGLAYRLVFDQQAPATGGLEFKRGPLGDVNCADPSGYRILFSVPPVVFRREFPHRICVRLSDEAGNQSQPLTFDFGPPSLQPFGIRNAASLMRTRQVARGSRFRIEGIELDGIAFRGSLVDAAGARHDVPIVPLDGTRLEALLPLRGAEGPARLTLEPGSLTLDVEVTPTSPGLYTANYAGFIPPLAYYQKPGGEVKPAFECGLFLCTEVPIPVAGGFDLWLVGTGISNARARIFLGGIELETVESNANAEWPGVDNVHVRVPAGFPLHGYQLLRAGEHNLRLILDQ